MEHVTPRPSWFHWPGYFGKFVVSFVGLVVLVLMVNGALEAWLTYRDTTQLVAKGDDDYNTLFREGVTTAYAPHDEAVYAAYLELFRVLSLAVRTPNRVFLSHSLPSPKYLEGFDLALLSGDNVPAEAFLPKGSLYGLVWGRDTREEHAAAFLAKVGADFLVSGHIVCDEGFATPNPRQVILDCSHSPAAFGLFPADRPLSREEFVGSVRRI